MVGLCSFSETRDHELMWAHYADQFRGICVAYSFSKLLSYLPADIAFVRMYYNETEPTIHGGQHDIDNLVRRVLSNKNYKWLYEREWRMFAQIGKVTYGCPNCVTDVYLGSRISDEHREYVTDKMSKLHIKVHDLTIKKYKIEFEPCEATGPGNWGAH